MSADLPAESDFIDMVPDGVGVHITGFGRILEKSGLSLQSEKFRINPIIALTLALDIQY